MLGWRRIYDSTGQTIQRRPSTRSRTPHRTLNGAVFNPPRRCWAFIFVKALLAIARGAFTHRCYPSVLSFGSMFVAKIRTQNAVFSKTNQFRVMVPIGLYWRPIGSTTWTFQRTHYWAPKIQDGDDPPSWKSWNRNSSTKKSSDFEEILYITANDQIMNFFTNSRWRIAAILKSFFAITQQPIAQFQWNFAWGSSYSQNCGSETNTGVP